MAVGPVFFKYSILRVLKLSEKQYSGKRHLKTKTLNYERVNMIKLLKSLKITISYQYNYYLISC